MYLDLSYISGHILLLEAFAVLALYLKDVNSLVAGEVSRRRR